MSAARFKSKSDYFSKRSGLAERVISTKPQKSPRKREIETAIPVTLLRVHFCKTVERFEIEGRGKYRKGEYPLDDALRKHLDGEETVLVNPLSPSGETAFTVVRFDLSDEMDHPFSKARRYADELQNSGIPSIIEVAEGGKGHYHLWIFHEEPVRAWPFSEALIRLGQKLFDVCLETVPSVRGEEYLPLPLQGESLLLQRRVFVNAVGKMIRDQGNVLRNLDFCPKDRSEALVTAWETADREPVPTPPEEASAVPEAAETPAPVPKPSVGAAVPEKTPDASKTGERAATAPEKPASPPAKKPAAAPVKPKAKADKLSAGKQVSSKETAQPRKTAAKEAKQKAAPSPPVSPAKTVTEAGPVAAADIETSPETGKEAEAGREKNSAPDTVTVIRFTRSQMVFALEAGAVERITGSAGLAPTPDAGGVAGTMERDGQLLTVLDPGFFQPGKPGSFPARARILALGGRWRDYGLLADTVEGPVRASREPADSDEESRRQCVVARETGERMLLPDMERMVSGLSRPSEIVESSAARPDPGGRYVLFRLNGRLCGIPVQSVREVRSGPGDPESGTPEGRKRRVLVVESGASVSEIMVDAVSGVRSIPAAACEGVTAGAGSSTMPVTMIARIPGGDGPALILDPNGMAGRRR